MHISRPPRENAAVALGERFGMSRRSGRRFGPALIGAVLFLAGCADTTRSYYEGPPPLVYPPAAPSYVEPPPATYARPAPVPQYYAPPAYVPGPTLYLEEQLREERRRAEFRREEL